MKKWGISMAAGFRKSLFGFQKDDVLSYINQLNNAADKREKELTEALAREKKQADSLQAQLAVANEMASKLSEQLAVFEQQKNEMRLMSENIGRLYLVAKSSAALLMKNAEDSRATVEAQTNESLRVLMELGEQLDEAKNRVNETARRYDAEVEGLAQALACARQTLAGHAASSEEAVRAYEAVAAPEAY